MGRPKLSDLSCAICNEKFNKRILLEKHMKNHSSSKQSRKHLKSYCYTCGKSFEPDKYKLHLQTEHQFDFPKVNISAKNDLYSCENELPLLSKKKIKEENHMSNEKLLAIEKGKSLVVSVMDIKIEPNDKVNEEFDWEEHEKVEDKISIKKSALQSKVLKLKCSVCGMGCKGKKGLKIHMNTHKMQSSHDSTSQNETETLESVYAQSHKMINATTSFNNPNISLSQSHTGINATSLSNNPNVSLIQPHKSINATTSFNSPNIQFSVCNAEAAYYAQNAQPNYILNFSQFQNQPNLMISANQPIVQVVPNQNNLPSDDDIPKFDWDSEEYMKWLKKLISKCKMHNYPLNLELCKKIKCVSGELVTALCNPKSSLKQKANHFYFMSAYNTLSEIMLNHLQYTLCDVSK